jgi:hypothetical protein
MQLICLTNPKFRLKCSNHVFIRQSDNTMTESQVSTAWFRTQIARSLAPNGLQVHNGILLK